MLNLTRVYCGVETPGDPLRYGRRAGAAAQGAAPHEPAPSARHRKPVVVWTMTRSCNLRCVHCYADSADLEYPGELTLQEGKRLLADLAAFGVPAVLLSGGEPLRHPNFFELSGAARALGLRLTLSSNGTLITADAARRIKETGFSYVGISFDGLGAVNDRFRGQRGAFDQALAGLRHLKAAGQRVGLRFTLTRRNYEALPEIFEFVVREGIDRVCFYHLVYAGRGSRLAKDDLSHAETRQAVEAILSYARQLSRRPRPVEVLTVDNPVDGVFAYLTLRREGSARAGEVRQLLAWNGGGRYGSGVAIANVDSYGNVHPDQFWQTHTLGNVRDRAFSEIWTDPRDPLLTGLRDRLPRLEGRCSGCRWLPLCGGGFRARALQATGRQWAPDPACYLSDDEIA